MKPELTAFEIVLEDFEFEAKMALKSESNIYWPAKCIALCQMVRAFINDLDDLDSESE